jgi:putative hydrolase of the HAD superfamily
VVTILLDADGVVQRQPAGWLDRLVARIGVTDREPRDVLKEIFAAEEPTVTGVGDFRAALAALLTDWGRIDRLDAVLSSWLEIEVDDGVLGIVGQLRARGIGCYLATNQQSMRATYMHSLYDGHFDGQFYSCELGVAKPERAYFAAVLERLATPAEQVVFVDDRPANIDAARQLGIDARLYTGPEVITGIR